MKDIAFMSGKYLKQLRKDSGITQEDLSEAIHVNRVQIAQWESGTREMPASAVLAVSNYFRVSCDYVLTGKESDYISMRTVTNSGENVTLNENVLHPAACEPEVLQARLTDADPCSAAKDKEAQLILERILDSEYFWDHVMTSIQAACHNSCEWEQSVPPLPADKTELLDKLKESVHFLEFCNMAGIGDRLLLSKEQAADFYLNKSSDQFYHLLTKLFLDAPSGDGQHK